MSKLILPGKKDIREIKKKLREDGAPGLALDIDETLSWTIGWWVERLAEQFGNPEKLTTVELIQKYRYAQKVPYWANNPKALQWMKDHQEDNSIQENLPLIENADLSVQKINRIVPIVAYLTTRPESVIDGTKVWLKRHSFPVRTVFARPKGVLHENGNKWKARMLELLYPEVRGIIDDNPGLAQELSDNYPGVVFMYDNSTVPRKGLNLVACQTWNDVETAVAERFRK